MEERTARELAGEAGSGAKAGLRDRLPGLAVVWGLALVWVVLDQLSKQWALGALAAGQQEIIPGFLYFTLARNPGAAFSLLPGGRVLFITLTFFLLGVGIWAPLALGDAKRPWVATLGFALLVGGALGNLVDRLFRDGLVVDFIDVRFWPIFNLADTGICVGSGIVLLYLVWNLFRPEVKPE